MPIHFCYDGVAHRFWCVATYPQILHLGKPITIQQLNIFLHNICNNHIKMSDTYITVYLIVYKYLTFTAQFTFSFFPLSQIRHGMFTSNLPQRQSVWFLSRSANFTRGKNKLLWLPSPMVTTFKFSSADSLPAMSFFLQISSKIRCNRWGNPSESIQQRGWHEICHVVHNCVVRQRNLMLRCDFLKAFVQVCLKVQIVKAIWLFNATQLNLAGQLIIIEKYTYSTQNSELWI